MGSLNLKIGTTNLTDDSVTNNGSAVLTNVGRQYNIVSQSRSAPVFNTINPASG